MTSRSRLDRATAWLRLAMTLISALVVLTPPTVGPVLGLLWLTAVAYAAILTLGRPRFISERIWWALTGMIDWTLISTAIVLSGGLSSELYVLYFVLAFGSSVRFGLRESVLCGASTALTYFLLMFAVTPSGVAVFPVVALRMGYLMAIAVGSGLLAREADRATRADVSHEAEQSAVRGVAGALSHELINPLAAASGLVEILLDTSSGPLSVQQRTLLSGLDGHIEHAHGLVRNVVTAERLERGHYGYRPTLGDINGSVQGAVNDLIRLAEARQIGVVLTLAPSLPMTAFDAPLIHHALSNILSNALQFTPSQGAVRVSSALSRGRLVIETWNSGGSISGHIARTLFGKYVRDRSRGIGLGLYVAKLIVDLHGGELGACNAADGVTVTLSLPCTSHHPNLLAAPDDSAWALRRDPALAS